MKILYVITSLHGDGAQRMLLRLISALGELGHESVVVSLRGSAGLTREFITAGAQVEHIRMSKGFGALPALLRLAGIIKMHRPDVIQGWMYHANLAALLGSGLARSGAPLVWSIRRSMDDFDERRLLTRAVIRATAQLSRYVDALIYPAQITADQHRAAGFRPRREFIMPNGYPVERFTRDPISGRALREQLGIPPSAPVFGKAARYDTAKDHPTLLRAARQIFDRLPEAYLLLAGRGMDMSNRELRRRIGQLRVGSRVKLLGQQADLTAFFSAIDVYCSSSVCEGFPNSLTEAMLSLVPCVATDVGATREVVRDTGVVVRPGDAEAIADGVIRLLSEETGRRLERGELARRHVIENYSMRTVAQRYLKHLAALLPCEHAALPIPLGTQAAGANEVRIKIEPQAIAPVMPLVQTGEMPASADGAGGRGAGPGALFLNE